LGEQKLILGIHFKAGGSVESNQFSSFPQLLAVDLRVLFVFQSFLICLSSQSGIEFQSLDLHEQIRPVFLFIFDDATACISPPLLLRRLSVRILSCPLHL
jgi:hypothetical protein